MNKRNFLIGVGILIVGYLLYKKSNTNVKEYSENCKAQLKMRLMQEDAKPPNFENDFLERCRNSEIEDLERRDTNMNVGSER